MRAPQVQPTISTEPPAAAYRPHTDARLLLIAAGGLLHILGETLAFGAAGALSGTRAGLIVSSTLVGIGLLWLALWWKATPEPTPAPRWSQLFRRFNQSSLLPQIARRSVLALLVLAVLWSILVNGTLLFQHPLDPASYDSDAASFIHYQAEDVLQGINPYTDATGFWRAVQHFPGAGATPLRRGQWSQQDFSPPDAAVAALLQRYAQNPTLAGPEFDPASLHSYPAGAFLLAVPFIWAGFPSTQPLYALALLLLFGLLLWWAPGGLCWLALLFLASLSVAITLTLRSSFEVICILCVIGAWRFQARHPILAALLLGLGCSVKQLAWLFVPFYLLWVLRRSGWRQAAASLGLIGLTFFAINAPFIFASPAAWANSMLLPITEPAFPGGLGLITLAQGGWLPLFPSWVYTLLEGATYSILLAWYGVLRGWGNPLWTRTKNQAGTKKNQRQPTTLSPEAWGLFLALLPLLLASRSLISYTMFLPVLAFAALLQSDSTPKQIPLLVNA